MNLKTAFNWLAAKDDLPITLGHLARRTVFKGTKLETSENFVNLTRGGRIAERGVTLSSCFAAASAVSFMSLLASTPFISVPFLGYAIMAAVILGIGKTAGLVTGKVTDVATKVINNSL